MRKSLLKFAAVAMLFVAAITTGHAQIPITLETGWNWISYPYSEPMTIQEALAGFIPANGDIIQAQSGGNATYRNGRWMGQLTTLIPGEGYMYQSVYGGTRYFIFGGATNDPSALPEAALDGEFTVDANGTKVRFSPGNLQCLIDPDMNKEAVVGTTGTSTSYQYPYNTYYNYSLCEMLYTADELAAAGLAPGPIKSIAFQSNSDLYLQRNNIRVWLANTTATEMGSPSVSTSNMTMVFEGGVIQLPGWTEIPCGSTFSWDGTSNVRVTVVMNHGSYDNPYVYWNSHSTSFTSCGYAYNDYNAYAPEANPYSLNTVSERPNIRFKGNGVRWRFAENQTDYIGAANANIGPNNYDWIDLFGWGTSGHPHGANCYQPWSTSQENSDYYAYGIASHNLHGEADWGCNPISNGGNQPGQWRTLSNEEWGYVFNTRSTTSGKRYAKATVNGVNGVILLPDSWSTSYYTLNSTNTASADFTSNTITSTQWPTLEQHGAVFLPAAGRRTGTSLYNLGSQGCYQSTTYKNNFSARSMWFNNSVLHASDSYGDRCGGRSVRLVCQSNPRIRTIGVSNVQGSAATVTAEVDCTGSTTVGERGVCWSTTPIPTVSNSHATSGSGAGGYTVNLSNLASGTTYYVRAYATIGGNTVYGNVLSFISQADLISVTTSWVSDVGQTTARGGGSLSGNGVSTMAECGICWSTLHNPTTSDRHTNSNTSNGSSFACKMTGLTPSTTYYVRAYAINSAGTSYGSERSFTTAAVAAPTVTTGAVTDITCTHWSTATVGGTVTNEGGATVTERGFCWGTSSNPTISGNHQSAGTGLGSFTMQITGLNPNTTYYVRAYATNSQGTTYGSQKTFTTPIPQGAINGKFSISADHYVLFSQGNLQYSATGNTWRFAEHQYDYIGSNNSYIAYNYAGWIDLFGWGASGYNHGAVCYQPWSTSTTNSDYYAYGSYTYNLNEQTGQADWGYNPISNGGNTANQWSTLTKAEWYYIFYYRTTTSGIRYAKASVNLKYGIILLPDDWSASYYTLSNTNTYNAHYNSNNITEAEWIVYFEAHGAVFLPAAGRRNGTSVNVSNSYGRYWSATQYYYNNNADNAYVVSFEDIQLGTPTYEPRSSGCSVRLVKKY